jgi:DNA-3-methyladenine glycosylase II
VVAALKAEQPGFFTAAKASPYDAATWAIIVARTSMASAARVKLAMAHALGDAVAIDGRVHHVFPGPAVLARLDRFAGLPDVKVARLRGIGRAALDGRLDADRLRAMPEDDALADLSALDGVGPWTASHILFRGAAPPDALPTAEPRVLHGFAHAYGLSAPTEATFRRVAGYWRPFRMWVCILLSRHLARSGAWHAPGIARERDAAGGALRRRVNARVPAPAPRPEVPTARPIRAA